MEKRKMIGFSLILLGLLIIAYPLKLRMYTRMDRKKLREEFNKDIDDIAKQSDIMDTENKIVEYDSWPDTLMTIPDIDVFAANAKLSSSTL